jgi:Protein of unknown function (DUF3667)
LILSETKRARAPDDVLPGTGSAAHRCGNCESMLTGPYCAVCGQHAHASARNLAAVLHDGWHDLTHVDGRLWHSLWVLLRTPGRLTAEYFQERRARYLPPVRLYLVLSLVFFTMGLGSVQRTDGGPSTEKSLAAALTDDQDGDDKEVAAALGKVGKAIDSPLPCEGIQIAGFRSLERAAREACLRNVADHGKTFLKALVHNTPKMMFVFLPLMAAVMTLLYWRPRRYYVEHLVLLLHNHSALFLCFVLLRLSGALANLWQPLSKPMAIEAIVAVIYVTWYPYAAMRRYYGQGKALTASKYAVIVSAYFVCLLLTLLGTAAVTALNE